MSMPTVFSYAWKVLRNGSFRTEGKGTKFERGRNLKIENLEARQLLSAAPWEVGQASLAGFYSFENGTESEVGEIAGVCYGDASTQYSEVLQSGVLSFDGNGDYVGLGNPAEMNFSGQITLSAWVKADAANGIRNIIAHGNTTNPKAEVFLRINGNHYEIGSWNGSDHLARAAMSAGDVGTWVHLAGTYDGTAWHLYRNGVEIASQTAAVGAIPVNSNWCIGAAGDGTQRFFRGGVDDVKIFDNALSQTELEELAAPREILMPTSVEGWSCAPSDAGILYGVNGNVDGELRNGARFTEDSVRGGALDFMDNNGYVTLGDAESMQITGEITLSAWVKPNSTSGTQNIISKGFTTNPSAEIVLRINNGRYEIGSWDGANHFASAAISAEDVGTWVHLLGTYDGTTWKLFRNGELAATRTDAVGAISVEAGWVIGASAAALTGNTSARYFDGQITDIQVFNTQVTARQAAAFAAPAEKVAPKPVELRPVTIGGEAYALCDSAYQLSLDSNENQEIHWEVNWGDSNVDHYTSEESVSHNYAKPGAYTITVTAKVGGQNIPMTTSEVSVNVYEKGNLIVNGDFEATRITKSPGWEIFYGGIEGWSGTIELQGGQIAELDTDTHQSDADHGNNSSCGNKTTITSISFPLILGAEYTLSFRSWNRSDYAEDNMVKVVVPGTVTAINQQTVASLSSLKAAEASKPKWENSYSCLEINSDSVTYSAGGATYREEVDGVYVEHAGCTNYSVYSITFVATQTTGAVMFSDASTDDVVPSYGPYLDDVSLPAKYVIADIDVDSNNDGVIDEYDDPVETISFGQVVGAGTTFSVHVEPKSNFTMDSSRYGARIKSSNQAVVATAPDGKLLTLGMGNVELQSGITPGTTTLTYEVYEKSTGTVLASDSVYITTINPVVSITASKPVIYEGMENFSRSVVTLSLDTELPIPIRVHFTASGNATANVDYTLTRMPEGTIVGEGEYSILFLPGETEKSFTINSLADSNYNEAREYLQLNIARGNYYTTPQDAYNPEETEEPFEPLRVYIAECFVDLDIDSDNNLYNTHQYSSSIQSANYMDIHLQIPGRTDYEESLEENPYGAGKLIPPNWEDSDGDGRIDCWDGFGNDILGYTQHSIFASNSFIPLVIEIPQSLAELEDAEVVFNFADFSRTSSGFGNAQIPTGGNGAIRIWTVDGKEARLARSAGGEDPGHLVCSGVPYSLHDLGVTTDEEGHATILLYIEGCEQNINVETLKNIREYRYYSSIGIQLFPEGTENEAPVVEDRVNYVVAAPGTFMYELVHNEHLRALVASQLVYSNTYAPYNFCLKPLDESELRALFQEWEVCNDAMCMFGYPPEEGGDNPLLGRITFSSGFKAGMYKDYISGKYIVAFAGTENLLDWAENLVTSFAQLGPQYTIAREIGKVLAHVPSSQILFAGHSLGGGLASMAAIGTGGTIPAVTFNSAGFNRDIVDDHVDSDEEGDIYLNAFDNAENFITAYHIQGELLRSLQNSGKAPIAIGNRKDALTGPNQESLEVFLAYSIRLHSLESLFYGFLKRNGVDMYGY